MLSAGKDISLKADGDLSLLDAKDRDYRFASGKKKRAFGGKKIRLDESERITSIGTEIRAGRDVLINVDKSDSGLSINAEAKDLTLVGASIKAGGDSILYAGEELSIVAASESTLERHEVHKSGFLGLSKKGKEKDNQKQGLAHRNTGN